MSTLINQNSIPIIDMAYIGPNDVWPVKSCTRQSAHKLCKALNDHGLALLVNHGITEMKLQRAYRKIKYFSTLSEKDKKDFEISSNSLDMIGYYPPGPKISGSLVDYKHSYVIKAEGSEPLPFCFTTNDQNSIEDLIENFRSLACTLLQFISLGLGLSPKEFRSVYDEFGTEKDESLFELMYYPPTDDCVPLDEKFGEEKLENGMFVLIAQDSESGLQVFKSKKWETVGYLPGALLLISGKQLLNWSKDLGNPVPYRYSLPLETSARSRSRNCAIFSSRISPTVIELCPIATVSQLHTIETIISSTENLSDEGTYQNLSSFHRFLDFIWKACRFPCNSPPII